MSVSSQAPSKDRGVSTEKFRERKWRETKSRRWSEEVHHGLSHEDSWALGSCGDAFASAWQSSRAIGNGHRRRVRFDPCRDAVGKPERSGAYADCGASLRRVEAYSGPVTIYTFIEN
jgi:hypothetical protein